MITSWGALSFGCDVIIALMNSAAGISEETCTELDPLMFCPGERKVLLGSTLPQGSSDD